MNPTSDPVLASRSTYKNVSVGQGEALHEIQDETNDAIQSPKGVLGSKSSVLGSNAELEAALNKFFGGPPFCLITPDCIEAHTKPRTGKRVCRGRIQSFQRSYAIVTWMDGRLVEMSAENYHFIALGYPQRMMQLSYMPVAQREEETVEVVENQDISPFNAAVKHTEALNNPVPDPMDMARSSAASDLSHQSEKSIKLSEQSEVDIKVASDVAQEFEAETARRRPDHREAAFQSQHKQGFSGWTPILVLNNPIRPEDDPIKGDLPTHIDGSIRSSDVPKQSQSEESDSGNKGKLPATPTRRKNVFIPWTPSPKKEGATQEGPAASTTFPRAGAPMRYSSRELSEGPAFIKALVEAGTPWEEQEELYESEFGISRPISASQKVRPTRYESRWI
ncbi:unnamed protein product [Penicillium glandicola]